MAEILKQTDGLIDFDILINGKKIKDWIEVIQITIEMEVNRISSAVLVVQDGGPIGAVNEPYTNSEGMDFIPGNEIEISLGYTDKVQKVFKGMVVSQGLKIKGGRSRLTVTCHDKAINMTKGRRNAFFQNKTDSDAIKSIVAQYGLDFEMDAKSLEHPVLVQYNCSDWDYLIARAEANKMLVNTYQNKLSIKKVDFKRPAQYEIKSSQIVIDIDLSLESEDISGTYNMSSWNPDTQNIVSTSLQVNDSLGQGNLSAETLSKNMTNSFDAYSSTPIQKEEMKAWLESQADSAVLEKIQGKITIPGTTGIIAGDLIMLSEFSKRYNGKAFISKVVHVLQDGEWLTKLYVGRSAKRHASLKDVEDMGASGLIPGAKGSQIAKVKQIDQDPQGNYRILVTLPAFTGIGQTEGIWARLAVPYASSDAGFYFFPEKGDEVLLSFIDNDPRFPVITGSLYSAKNQPSETPDDKNQFKSIRTRSGISIKFDDEDKILSIETPNKNSIVLDDKSGHINIKDSNGNAIVMDASGITMKSQKDINLEADGNINLSAKANLTMKASADATLDGLSITQSAETSFTAKGNASAELSAAGQTTLKGAMVMIN